MGKTESDQIEVPLPLLLDEVTSALDRDTEKRLLENLQHLEDRTAVIVSHRPPPWRSATVSSASSNLALPDV